MPLLIVLFAVCAALLLWVLLLPLWLWRRFHLGKARRRLLPFWMRLNAWLLGGSLALFLLGAGMGHWLWPGSFTYACAGVLLGVLSALVGLRLGRLERLADGNWFYTPSAAWTLLLMAVVVARLVLGAVDLWRRIAGLDALAWMPAFDHAGLFALGGLLLGHGAITAWGLRWRVSAGRR